MNRIGLVAAAAVVVGAAPAAKDPPPIANYWMDVATPERAWARAWPGRPGQMMSMMSGGGGAVMHSLDLRLARRTNRRPRRRPTI